MVKKSHSNTTLIQVVDDLNDVRQNLLLIQAAFLAFEGAFADTSLSYRGSPYQSEEVAQYFIIQFLQLDPDQKLRRAIDFLLSLRDGFDSQMPEA